MNRTFRLLFVGMFSLILISSLSSKAQEHGTSNWRTFLQGLTGTWELTGSMGSLELHQRCKGRWVLQNNFFQMNCEAVPPDTSGYRSIYIIGYHSEKHHYIFHLFDTFGGNYSETLGFGKRKNDRIPFEFDYPEAPFQNIFIWNEKKQEWKMILKQKDQGNKWVVFAEKTLRKRSN
ncbi:MAG: hypothetical protein PVI44_12585 [Balneolaceae bacterium]